MAVDQVNIPDGIGRNDPCPCGSGKKYKKCHFQKHRIEKEAQKSTVSVPGLVNSKSSPWDMYKILTMIHANNVANLLWELSHDQSPFRAKYPTLESYLGEVAIGTQRLPANPDYELLIMRHDGPDAILLLTSGFNDPKMQSVRAEIITFRPNQIDKDRKPRRENYFGYRLWDIDYTSIPKSEIKGEEPTLEDFDVKWGEKWDAPEGWYPPIPQFSTSKDTTSPATTQFAAYASPSSTAEEE